MVTWEVWEQYGADEGIVSGMRRSSTLTEIYVRSSISADLTWSSLFLSSQQQRDNDSVSGESGDEFDPFNDPDDKWEKDFKLDSPSGRFGIHMLFSFAPFIFRFSVYF